MTTTTVGKVERAVRAILSPTDTRRVELYLRLSETLDEVAVASEETHQALQDVLNDPNVSDEDKEQAKDSFAKAGDFTRNVINKMTDAGFEGTLPTPDMLRAYALIEIARAIDEMRIDMAEIKQAVELG
jgi:hypothetical protein